MDEFVAPDALYFVPCEPATCRPGETKFEALLRQIRENPKTVAVIRGLTEK